MEKIIMDSQLNNKWLSLSEYSDKYNVSVSTLRRRIRTDQLNFNLRYGKYFLKDQNLFQLENKKDSVVLIEQVAENIKNINLGSLKNLKNDLEDSLSKEEALVLLEHPVFLDKLKQIKEKEIKLSEQQTKISDLNILVALLEKDNRELKYLLKQWLEIK